MFACLWLNAWLGLAKSASVYKTHSLDDVCLSLNSITKSKPVSATGSTGHGNVSFHMVTLPDVITEAFWVTRVDLQRKWLWHASRLIFVQL